MLAETSKLSYNISFNLLHSKLISSKGNMHSKRLQLPIIKSDFKKSENGALSNNFSLKMNAWEKNLDWQEIIQLFLIEYFASD